MDTTHKYPVRHPHGALHRTGNPGLAAWQQIGVHTIADTSCLINRLIAELRPLGYPDKELFGHSPRP